MLSFPRHKDAAATRLAVGAFNARPSAPVA